MAIGCDELSELLKKKNIKPKKDCNKKFDKFYNDYTKIYPTSGGLSKTAHLKGILKQEEVKVIDGIENVLKFLQNINNPENKKIKFLDCTFCIGSCIGGPLLRRDLSLDQKKKRVIDYVEYAKKERMPENAKGIIKEAKGIKFSY